MKSTSLEAATRQRNFLIVLATAGTVFGVLIVQRILNGIFGAAGAVVMGNENPSWQIFVPRGLALDLLFAVGVFICLWRITPITPALRILPVIVRGLLMSASGAVLVFVANALFGLSEAIGGLIGVRTGFDTGIAHTAISSGIWGAGGYFVSATPVVILAAVVLWILLEKLPRDTPIHELSPQV